MSQTIPPEHAIHILPAAYADKLGLPADHKWLRAIEAIRTGNGLKPRGTLKAWALAHNGARIDMLQIQPRTEWRPGVRTLEAGKSSARLDGSGTDYAGKTVLHADDNTIIFTYDWGGPAYVVWTLED